MDGATMCMKQANTVEQAGQSTAYYRTKEEKTKIRV